MEQIAISYHFGKEEFHIIASAELVPTVEAVIRSLIPNAQFGTGRLLQAQAAWEGEGTLTVQVDLDGLSWNYRDLEILDPRYNEFDRERRIKERVRMGTQRVLEQTFNLAPSPWGILLGVRPTKLVHSLLDRGFSPEEVVTQLETVYGLSEEKIELILPVVIKQRKYFHSSPNQPVSIYVGIPFCPTRCSYCSFAAYPLGSHGHLLPGFLQGLKLEIAAMGRLLDELGVEVETIYLGGGTPTTVQGADLEELLNLIREYLVTPTTCEFTVEAGRPETLTRETMHILRNAKVDRISINPQTMHQATLDRIGRQHSVEQVYTAYDLAREVGIPIINMDIILGLPGEKWEHVEETLRQIAILQPDNLTVHSLAIKRASRLKQEAKEIQIAQEEGEAMANLAKKFASTWGMSPYYLYRQRYILGDLENIGYAKPSLESRYNIQMMEERQTIIALGGGGITKLVAPDLSLVRLANPKCPATYSQQIFGDLEAKIDQIRKHLLV
ncbi:MAG: coproporphyrinogen dehydrogenase HemZ [Firmicutes bacterium]|nr:coproporphyrinogen dehydrogenase HemZ [Bacillota bacterium]